MEINKNWEPKAFPTGLINPATGKEWILSGYYRDETGNKHFTHDEALKIWDSVPGWGPCTDEFHQALYEAVWDEEADDWRKDILGSGLNGFEYMKDKLGYELGGYRDSGYGTLYLIGQGGYSWSSSVPAGSSGAHYLHFSDSWVNPQNNSSRACGFQVRCLKED